MQSEALTAEFDDVSFIEHSDDHLVMDGEMVEKPFGPTASFVHVRKVRILRHDNPTICVGD